MSIRLHIGFDFWGAGNLGDDLMLAGFLGWMGTRHPEIEVSALCGHDIAAMQARFPAIAWYPSDAASRETALRQADAWIGLGGGVFQVEVGTWILDQMAENLAAAKARGIPRFLVGVGVNNREALRTPQAALVHELADRIWLRDASCVDMALAAGFSGEKTLLGADAGHLAAARFRSSRPAADAAFVLHADERAFSPAAVAAVVEQLPLNWSWLCQESRPLADSETSLHSLLAPAVQERLPLIKVDYATATLPQLFEHVSRWSLVLSSRYHTTLASAWAGTRIAVFERNQKLSAIRQEFAAEPCRSVASADNMVRALRAARPVSPALLQQCYARAETMLASVVSAIVGR